jgi:hypothetical protein
VVFFVFLLTFELFWQCGILCFSADFWTVLTVFFVFLLTFELFWQCVTRCSSIDLWHTVRTVQRSIEKQRIQHCQNSSKVNRKTKNNTLSEVQRSTEKQRIPKASSWFLSFRSFFPVSSTNKVTCHYITEKMLKMVLNTITIALKIRQHDPSAQHYGVKAKTPTYEDIWQG